MEISEKTEGGADVICLSGRLDAYAANDLEQKLNSLISAKQICLVLDLKEMDYISSSGLRVFLATLKSVTKQKGDIRLACLQSSVKEVFELSGFTQMFKMFDSVEDAVKSFDES